MFANRIPTDKGTLSPELLAKRGDSIYSFNHVCLLESPKRSPPTYIQEKKRSLSTEMECLHALGRGLVPQGDR